MRRGTRMTESEAGVENDDLEGPALKEAWQKGQPVELDRSGAETSSSVLSVRMPRSLLKELSTAARRIGKGPATLARELIEQGLALDHPASNEVLGRVLGRVIQQLPSESVHLRLLPLHTGPSASFGSWLSYSSEMHVLTGEIVSGVVASWNPSKAPVITSSTALKDKTAPVADINVADAA
jgi:predicted DNA-binding protein